MTITPAELELGFRLRTRIEGLLADALADESCPDWLMAETACDAPILLISGPSAALDLEVGLDDDLDAESILAFAIDRLTPPDPGLLPGFAASRRADCSWAMQAAEFHASRIDPRFSLTARGPLLVIIETESERIATIDRERADFFGGAGPAIEFTTDDLADLRFHPYSGESAED